jgi:hypothetical protein
MGLIFLDITRLNQDASLLVKMLLNGLEYVTRGQKNGFLYQSVGVSSLLI